MSRGERGAGLSEVTSWMTWRPAIRKQPGGSRVGPPTKRDLGRAAPAVGWEWEVLNLAHACNIYSSRMEWIAARV